MQSDDLLIKRCQKKKDLDAFECLIKKHQNLVRSLVYKFFPNSEDFDDVSQEVFIKIFKNIESYKFTSSFSTWLYSVAVNTCKDKLRSNKNKQKRLVSTDEDCLHQIPDSRKGTAEQTILQNEEQAYLLQEINKLPEKHRIPLVLHDIEEVSYEEIAKICDCPVGTVKSRIFNARNKLRIALQEKIQMASH